MTKVAVTLCGILGYFPDRFKGFDKITIGEDIVNTALKKQMQLYARMHIGVFVRLEALQAQSCDVAPLIWQPGL
ncbi:hypothetical protein [Caedibacter taeniospiralis]|uniref:hypothetical protein n=1 Tax=Caedibacter taeniospiralis TaxID=28907 RepID=UPI000C26F7F7|nr:hypothetical protein [Caedibacter taeniospiralis]